MRKAVSNITYHANIPLEGHHGREKRSSLSENLSINENKVVAFSRLVETDSLIQIIYMLIANRLLEIYVYV